MTLDELSAGIALRRCDVPELCGLCATCRSQGVETDVVYRLHEYIANLDEDENASIDGAIDWLRNAYPACPVDCYDCREPRPRETLEDVDEDGKLRCGDCAQERRSVRARERIADARESFYEAAYDDWKDRRR